jgi:cytochrome c-type biogenesis protein
MEVTFVLAFLGGLLSFLSPCILPIAPGYLGIVTGASFAELQSGAVSRAKVIRSTLLFIAGFTLVFLLMGVTSSYLGALLRANRVLLSRIGGMLVLMLGLHQGGWLRLPWLYREHRWQARPQLGWIGAFLTGVAFSLGWTPCVGPILGSILALAGSQAEPLRGLGLLLVYSLGLALPFLLLAIGFQGMIRHFNKLKPYFRWFEWAAGGLLILMGLLLLTGGMPMLSVWLMKLTGGWNPEDLLRR